MELKKLSLIASRSLLCAFTMIFILFLGAESYASRMNVKVGETKDLTLLSTAERINIGTKNVIDLFMPQHDILSITGVNPGVTVLTIEYENDQFEKVTVVSSKEESTSTRTILKYLRDNLETVEGIDIQVQGSGMDSDEDKIIITGITSPRNQAYFYQVIGVFPNSVISHVKFIETTDIEKLTDYLKKTLASLKDVKVKRDVKKIRIEGEVPGEQKQFFDQVTNPFMKDIESKVIFLKPKKKPKTKEEFEEEKKKEHAKKELPRPTIQIDVEIVEVSLTKAQDLGVDWFPSDQPINVDSTITGTGNPSIPKTISGVINYTISNLKLDLIALINSGYASQLASPKLKVKSGETADIQVGGQVPIVSTTANASSVEYKNFGTELQITPNYVPKNKIDIQAQASVSSLDFGRSVSGNPTIVKTKANTRLTIEDGFSFAIGGLIDRRKSVTASKIPLLGDLPFLGVLFKKTTSDVEDIETLIIMTPHIIWEHKEEGECKHPWLGTERAYDYLAELSECHPASSIDPSLMFGCETTPQEHHHIQEKCNN